MIWVALALTGQAQVQKEFFDGRGNSLAASDSAKAKMFRLVEYDATGKPKGIVKAYYILPPEEEGDEVNVLAFVGGLASKDPASFNGSCVWFNEEGIPTRWGYYKNGERINGRINMLSTKTDFHDRPYEVIVTLVHMKTVSKLTNRRYYRAIAEFYAISIANNAEAVVGMDIETTVVGTSFVITCSGTAIKFTNK